MWLRYELSKTEGFLIDFLKTIATRAEKGIDHFIPGYTHLQRAQPIRWSHWMFSYGMRLQMIWRECGMLLPG